MACLWFMYGLGHTHVFNIFIWDPLCQRNRTSWPELTSALRISENWCVKLKLMIPYAKVCVWARECPDGKDHLVSRVSHTHSLSICFRILMESFNMLQLYRVMHGLPGVWESTPFRFNCVCAHVSEWVSDRQNWCWNWGRISIKFANHASKKNPFGTPILEQIFYLCSFGYLQNGWGLISLLVADWFPTYTQGDQKNYIVVWVMVWFRWLLNIFVALLICLSVWTVRNPGGGVPIFLSA